jgi:hypothetical protein
MASPIPLPIGIGTFSHDHRGQAGRRPTVDFESFERKSAVAHAECGKSIGVV